MQDTPSIALATFSRPDADDVFPGLCVNGQVWHIASVPGLAAFEGTDLLGVFDRWSECEPPVMAFCRSLSTSPTQGAIALAELRLRLPLRPRQIICIGANYRRHVIEMMTDHDVGSEAGLTQEQRRERATRLMDHRAAHGQPYAFVKPASCLLPPGDDLVLPPDCAQIDWELELAVVIGRPCFRVSRENALDYVAGYAVANDISARDRLNRRDIPGMGLDFIAGKGAPGFFPFGPFIVPAVFAGDPQDLTLELRLNGQVMQHESTADMIFPVAALIEFVSTHMSLLPGDVISTGSPAGNGTHHGRFLQPGDLVEGRIEGLGSQRFSCVAEQLGAGAMTHRPFVALTEPER